MSTASKHKHPPAMVGAITMAGDIQAQLEESRRAQQELTTVNKLIEIIAFNLNINGVFEDFVNELRRVVNVDWASIVLIRDKEACFYALSSKIGSPWKAGDMVSIEGTDIA